MSLEYEPASEPLHISAHQPSGEDRLVDFFKDDLDTLHHSTSSNAPGNARIILQPQTPPLATTPPLPTPLGTHTCPYEILRER